MAEEGLRISNIPVTREEYDEIQAWAKDPVYTDWRPPWGTTCPVLQLPAAWQKAIQRNNGANNERRAHDLWTAGPSEEEKKLERLVKLGTELAKDRQRVQEQRRKRALEDELDGLLAKGAEEVEEWDAARVQQEHHTPPTGPRGHGEHEQPATGGAREGEGGKGARGRTTEKWKELPYPEAVFELRGERTTRFATKFPTRKQWQEGEMWVFPKQRAGEAAAKESQRLAQKARVGDHCSVGDG